MTIPDQEEGLPRGRPQRIARRKIRGKPLKGAEYVLKQALAGIAKTKRKPSMPKFSWDKS